MHFVIFGKYNIISTAFVKLLTAEGKTFDLLGHQDFDLSKSKGVIRLTQLITRPPDIFIFIDEYNNINLAEQNFYSALHINSLIPTILSNYAAKIGVPFVYYSSEQVFASCDEIIYTESSECNPSNYYGMSKLLGENAIQKSGCKYLIIRKSFVFTPYSVDFIQKILRKTMSNEIINAANDRLYYPTTAEYLVKSTMHLISLQPWNNVIHLAGFPATTPYEFTKYILSLMYHQNIPTVSQDIAPIKTEALSDGFNASAFHFCCDKAFNEYKILPESWMDILSKLELKYYL